MRRTKEEDKGMYSFFSWLLISIGSCVILDYFNNHFVELGVGTSLVIAGIMVGILRLRLK